MDDFFLLVVRYKWFVMMAGIGFMIWMDSFFRYI